MRSVLFLALLILASAVNLAAQFNQYGALVVWERYKVPQHNLSVLLPKLPTVNEEIDWCERKQSDSYYAFAEGTVYELKIVRELEGKQRSDCVGFGGRFSERTLKTRLAAVRNALKGAIEDKADLFGALADRFVSTTESRWIISDMYRNKRWIELAVHHYADEKPDFDRFVKSVTLGAADGKEIGSGSDSTLGDLTSGSALVAPVPTPVSPDTKAATPPPSPTPNTYGS